MCAVLYCPCNVIAVTRYCPFNMLKKKYAHYYMNCSCNVIAVT